jgi:hypothetical protein
MELRKVKWAGPVAKNETDENLAKNFSGNIWWEDLGDLDVDGRVIIKRILKSTWDKEVDWLM